MVVTEEKKPTIKPDGSPKERIAAIRDRLLANREQVVGKFTAKLLAKNPE